MSPFDYLKAINETGIGGMIIHFRLGAMPYDLNSHSMKLFADQVIPNFKT